MKKKIITIIIIVFLLIGIYIIYALEFQTQNNPPNPLIKPGENNFLAVATYNNKIYVTYVTYYNESDHLILKEYSNGICHKSYLLNKPLKERIYTSAMCCFNNKLFVFWDVYNLISQEQYILCSSYDGISWNEIMMSNLNGTKVYGAEPTCIVNNNTLFLIVTHKGETIYQYNGSKWYNIASFTFILKHGVITKYNAIFFKNKLYLFYGNGSEPSNLKWNITYRVFERGNWSNEYTITSITGNNQSNVYSEPVIYNNLLYVFYKKLFDGTNNENEAILYKTYDGNNWSDEHMLSPPRTTIQRYLNTFGIFNNSIYCLQSYYDRTTKMYYISLTIYDGSKWSNTQVLSPAIKDVDNYLWKFIVLNNKVYGIITVTIRNSPDHIVHRGIAVGELKGNMWENVTIITQ